MTMQLNSDHLLTWLWSTAHFPPCRARLPCLLSRTMRASIPASSSNSSGDPETPSYPNPLLHSPYNPWGLSLPTTPADNNQIVAPLQIDPEERARIWGEQGQQAVDWSTAWITSDQTEPTPTVDPEIPEQVPASWPSTSRISVSWWDSWKEHGSSPAPTTTPAPKAPARKTANEEQMEIGRLRSQWWTDREAALSGHTPYTPTGTAAASSGDQSSYMNAPVPPPPAPWPRQARAGCGHCGCNCGDNRRTAAPTDDSEEDAAAFVACDNAAKDGVTNFTIGGGSDEDPRSESSHLSSFMSEEDFEMEPPKTPENKRDQISRSQTPKRQAQPTRRTQPETGRETD